MRCDNAGARWLSSGAAALTGDRSGPALAPPPGVAARIDALGRRTGVDAFELVCERAAVLGLGRAGRTSCGGATRLLQARDGWIALALARPDDAELVPAWLETGDRGDDPWDVVTAATGDRDASTLVARGRMLGLPVARLGEVLPGTPGAVVERQGDAPPLRAVPLVIDLSSLWAGPLCARILGVHGVNVVKVESSVRPDGARRGPKPFFDLMHAGHRSVSLDFTSPEGRRLLHRVVEHADVVIEASRPRALQHLGLDARALVASGPRIWISITGYGRHDDGVAFGDDAAVAGGLVAWGGDGCPRFAADAIADPLTGLVAANAALDALAGGGRWTIDVSLARVAASVAGEDRTTPWTPVPDGDAHAPRVPVPAGSAAELGADNTSVLQELGAA